MSSDRHRQPRTISATVVADMQRGASLTTWCGKVTLRSAYGLFTRDVPRRVLYHLLRTGQIEVRHALAADTACYGLRKPAQPMTLDADPVPEPGNADGSQGDRPQGGETKDEGTRTEAQTGIGSRRTAAGHGAHGAQRGHAP